MDTSQKRTAYSGPSTALLGLDLQSVDRWGGQGNPYGRHLQLTSLGITLRLFLNRFLGGVSTGILLGMVDINWASLLLEPMWMQRLDSLCLKRFGQPGLAEEASTYVLNQLSKNAWETGRLRR